MKGLRIFIFAASLSVSACFGVHNPLIHDPFNFPDFPDFDNFFHGTGFPFNSYGSSNTGVNTHNTGVNTHNTNQGHTHHHTHQTQTGKLVCPDQLEEVIISTFSYDFVDYPLNAIALELALPINLGLLTCLNTYAVPGDVPATPPNPILGNSTGMCDYKFEKLAYFIKYGGRCWIIQNFQEMIYYSRCLTDATTATSARCKGCARYGNDYKSENRCVHTYRYESVWAFCDGKPDGEKVVRERIPIPDSCSCREINCYVSYHK